MRFPLLDEIGSWILIGFFSFLFVMETFFQLRKRTQSRMRRIFINTGVAVPSFILLRLGLIPAMIWLASLAQKNEFGLLQWIEMRDWIGFTLAFLLLDYFNYIWHTLNHRLPFLWRFHNVHHTDLDLDVTTAVRFHFGEIVASVVFRGVVVLLLGATPLVVLIYEIVFEAASNFHHSNWKLNERFEKFLQLIFVTPRMHGVHHSIVERETNSNFSVIFSVWDRLHRTIELSRRQEDITIGVAAYNDDKDLSVVKLLLMPFRKQRRGLHGKMENAAPNE